jgi:acyl carrier protein phosphodiesterase
MNHLAHLYLAPPEPQPRLGNVLGDFRRRLDTQFLPQPVVEGMAWHQRVDAFTDAHPDVGAARALFSPQRRRFAGVALDLVFDHFLIRHWSRFSNQSLEVFLQEVYRDLSSSAPMAPAEVDADLRRMIEYDWLRRCASLEEVGRILDRLAARLRFRNAFSGMLEEIEARESELEALFLAFFPELCAALGQNRSSLGDSG